MREIKFRQKLKPEYVKHSDEFHFWGYIDKGFISPVGKNHCNVDSEQSTGLKDKNGVEIFEGDIVSSQLFRPSLVKYSCVYACFCADDLPFCESHEFAKYWEIIGNIHENKELLK